MTNIDFIRDEDGDYSVIADGECIGYLCKRHDSGTGRAIAGYSGHVEPFNYWRWLPNSETINPSNFDKFMDAKRHIVNLYA